MCLTQVVPEVLGSYQNLFYYCVSQLLNFLALHSFASYDLERTLKFFQLADSLNGGWKTSTQVVDTMHEVNNIPVDNSINYIQVFSSKPLFNNLK